MTDFSPGQRWLSEAEAELGLGIVTHTDYRLVTLLFPACDQERTYSRQNAPLSRISWQPGDEIETVTGHILKIKDSETVDGVLVYQAHPEADPDDVQRIPETLLSHHLELRTASDRLFSGQLETPRWFELRHAALNAREQAQRSTVKGLRGPRVDLIGHQLYIAHEVGTRIAPRVLLADEVGLGKTIEAGMIIHQQLHTGQAQRVLIVVPEPLIHQWFVEMVRRFNLHFSIFDEQRIRALQASQADLLDTFGEDLVENEPLDEEDKQELLQESMDENPFLGEQLILCGSDFLSQCDFAALKAAKWDLLVVDEAHHLQWTPESASEDYLRVEQLALETPGLLLLTATPEQLGQESHFARLRLLDPDRFHSLSAFLQEQNDYQPVAELAARVHDEPQWDDDLKQQLSRLLPEMTIDEQHRDELLRELVDRKGTGRVLFRNTRRNISGFPRRELHPIALDCPDIYRQPAEPGDTLEDQLHPETRFNDDRWCAQDPRALWLADFLRQNKQDKILIICAHKNTAVDLEAWLSYKMGFALSVFHEDMDLIARDRAAAWFADPEPDSAQALICSEIGSEGRNFQFARHLVLLDLPLNPDLLEQRIGRLDRIGQQHDIQIHLPHFRQHPQEVLYRWYHQGMDAFCHTNPAGHTILERTGSLLHDTLQSAGDEPLIEQLVETTRETSQQIRDLMESGRDRLLELASCDTATAEKLIEQIHDADQQSPWPFMERVFERLDVNTELHSEHCHVVMPGDHMPLPFPHLPEGGITVTDDRLTALGREDVAFLTWEHPLVEGAIDLILSEDMGKASVCKLVNKKIPAGTLFVEALYTLESVAPRHLHVERFLPASLIRTLINVQGKDMGPSISHEALSKGCQKLDKILSRKVISSQHALLEQLLEGDQKLAQEQADTLIQQALEKMHEEQQHEINRLLDLQKKNPNIRQTEIDALQQRTHDLDHYLKDARCQLDAVRVIVVSD